VRQQERQAPEYDYGQKILTMKIRWNGHTKSTSVAKARGKISMAYWTRVNPDA